ncbi:acyl-CoA-binding protein [Gigaspora margarita]|uniref:Acyl-CoA-binding protein n=1 Tax=Gigaspora margarita TaxID=4874 RepID=A0A8H3ZY46_GIGMA|nr:acyl-CoA-binding protein [Gigaspora margarita]
MSTGNEAFNQAAKDFENIVKAGKSTNDEQLAAYGLFKQSTKGDNTASAPSALFSPKDKAKWDAWTSRKGLSQEEAQSQYIELIATYKEKYA